MSALCLDLLSRWRWALLAGALMSAFISWGILTDPETYFLSRGGHALGAGELILAALWGSLLISIDLARGTARVWAALPLRPSAVALSVWIVSVLAFPLLSTLIFLGIAIYAWLDGGRADRIFLTPLVLLNTFAYSGLAHLLFCESRTADAPRLRRDAGRVGYLLLLGGSYFAIGLYPPAWDGLAPLQLGLLAGGVLSAGLSVPATEKMLASLRGGERPAKPALARSGSGPGRRLAGLVRGPVSEGILLGLSAAVAVLAPVALIVWGIRWQPQVAQRILSLGGWNPSDVGFSLMICLVFGVVFVGFFAAHPWLNALRALRCLPYGPGRVAWTCLRPALAAVAALLGAITAPMAWMLGPELGPLLWYVALIAPPVAVAACAAYLRWGYAVVMAGVFCLIPVSLGVRRMDESLIQSPPLLPLLLGAASLLLLSSAVFLITIIRSPAAYRHKHVPGF